MMVRRSFLFGSAAFLAGCSGGNNNPQPLPYCPPGTVGVWPNCIVPPPPTPPDEWAIGPVIGGVSYSVGMPAATTGQAFEFPVGPNKHVGYLTRAPVSSYSLAGKSRIKLTFTIVGDGPYRAAASPPEVTYVGLYFQRQGDDWSAIGPYEGYRWFSLDSVPNDARLRAGTWSLEVPLQRDRWTSANTNLATEADFQAAMSNAGAVGFTFGNAGGKGHGVYSETPGCRFVVASYEVV